MTLENSQPKFKLGSLFDGIAGFPYAGRKWFDSVWASEIEKFPIQVSQKHFPEMKHLGDVKEINGAEVEPVDVITFGSPCQDLSVAGKREGLKGERSGLFMEAVRIVREMREATNGEHPRFALWENVPGAMSSHKGQDFRAVLEEILQTKIPMPKSGKWARAGMVRGDRCSVAWRILDAQYHGVPQRRRRVFLVADFAGQCAPEILFEPEGVCGHSQESREAREEVAAGTGGSTQATGRINCTEGGIAGTVSSKWAKGTGGPAGDEHYNLILFEPRSQDGVPRIHKEVFPTLNTAQGGQRQPCIAFQPGNLSRRAGAEPITISFEPGAMSRLGGYNWREVCGTLRAQMGDNQAAIAYPDPANTLLAKANMSFRGDTDNMVGSGYAVRRLTPTECERLMGLPDGWTEGGSDTARYKALGNSLAIPCAEWILGQIYLALTGQFCFM